MNVTYTHQSGEGYLLAVLDDGTVVRRTADSTEVWPTDGRATEAIRLAVERWAVEHPDSPLLHPSERPSVLRLASATEYCEPDAWLVARVLLGKREVLAWVDELGIWTTVGLSAADAERVQAFGLAALNERFPDHPLLAAERERAVAIPVLR